MNLPASRPVAAVQGMAASDAHEFSAVVGGPLFQILGRAGLSGEALDRLRRRVVAIALFAWAPLLVLSALRGQAWGNAVAVPFFRDVDPHTRLLLALPLLISAELVVHRASQGLLGEFVRRGIVPNASLARFDAAIASAQRLRNSAVAEVLLVIIVYALGVLYVWPRFAALSDVSTWIAVLEGGHRHLSPAGWWFVFVSLPIFQFFLLRWYFRLFVWARLLWQVQRCDLRLVPTHPDRVGGLGFLHIIPIALAPLILAHELTLEGIIADQILVHGARLTDFRTEVLTVIGLVLLAVMAPLLLFMPRLWRLKRVGLQEYGVLAQRYVREFDDKWIHGPRPEERLVGNQDIQSLADLANSFEIIQGIRPIPITRYSVLTVIVVTVLPMLPLLLTEYSLSDLKQLLAVLI